MKTRFVWWSLCLSVIAALSFACSGGGDNNGEGATPEDGGGTEENGGAMAEEMPADVAARNWETVSGYKSWNTDTDAPVRGDRPHGAWVHIFYNEVANGAVSGSDAWPDGSIVVKENYMPNEAMDGPGMLGALTAMVKENGGWFWAKYKPDGSLHTMPADSPMPNMPIAGTMDLKCISCHRGEATRDMVITTIGR